MATKKPQIFKVGDRVAERPKATAIPNLKPETQKRIEEYRKQRYGVVVDIFTKKSTARSKKVSETKYLRILWDGHQTPSEHAQMRICHERELGFILEGYCAVLG
jgi:hypothetical protein